ncbi:MAG: zf-TFIIB domain-containing protein [Planctomycetes bacterium]|nr:zf-TFIIB domain-containing protein [Planctomycetota bacterium]
MLVACKSCHRQYDVGGMEPGERIRCLCGELIAVSEPRSHTARVLHCSACGGSLQESASSCEYCGSSISLDERNLGDTCPECFARLTKGARFCRECGVKIAPAAIQALRLDARCPRCKGDLVQCTTERAQYTECSACGGLWLDEKTFEKVVEERDASPLGKMPGGDEDDQRSAREAAVHDVKYLACPVCGNLMHRKNFATCSGVIIDWCKGHGFWFDTHELEKIVDFARSGGMDIAREKEISRAKQELRRAESQKRWVQTRMYAGGGYGRQPVMTRSSADDVFSVLASTIRGLFGT